MQVLHSNSLPVDAGHCGRSGHRAVPRCCLTGKKLFPNWVAKFLQLGSKRGPVSPSPAFGKRVSRVHRDTPASAHAHVAAAMPHGRSEREWRQVGNLLQEWKPCRNFAPSECRRGRRTPSAGGAKTDKCKHQKFFVL